MAPNERRAKRIETYYANKIPGVELMVDNIHDPHNVAAFSRTADGLGIETIHLYYTYNKAPKMRREGTKTSGSANRWIRFNTVPDIAEFARERKAAGWEIVGTHMDPTSTRLDRFEFPPRCVIVMGAERLGMSPEVLAVCDRFLYIPMVGMVQSYNTSVAGSMILWELFKQRGSGLALQDPSTVGVRE